MFLEQQIFQKEIWTFELNNNDFPIHLFNLMQHNNKCSFHLSALTVFMSLVTEVWRSCPHRDRPVYWKLHSSNCPYHSQYHSFFSLLLFISCDSNKSLSIASGNSDVRPDPWQKPHSSGTHKWVKLHNSSSRPRRTSPPAVPPILQTLLSAAQHFIRLGWLMAGMTNAVCVHPELQLIGQRSENRCWVRDTNCSGVLLFSFSSG